MDLFRSPQRRSEVRVSNPFYPMRPSPLTLALVAASLTAGAVIQPISAQDPASVREVESVDEAPPPTPLDEATLTSAYLDENARGIVTAARERRRMQDLSVSGYEARAAERWSVGLRSFRRERVIWGREVVADVEWHRDGPIRINVLGATEAVPIASIGAQVPDDLDQSVRTLAVNPSDPYIISGLLESDDELDLVDPLGPQSEADYRFRSGSTRTIRLADGRSVNLVELEVLPRRRVPQLIRGSFWLDEETHGVVQVTFRLAAPWSWTEENPVDWMVGPVKADLEYITIEYGLWELRWWMPRLVSINGAMEIGRLGAIPIRYERTYSDYRVDAAPVTPDEVQTAEADLPRVVRCPTSIGVRAGRRNREMTPAQRDSLRAARDSARAEWRDRMTPEQREACDRYDVTLPDDPEVLRVSPMLSGVDFGPGGSLLSDAEMLALEERIAALGGIPLSAPTWELSGPLTDPSLARYNRVEGLSLGARVDADAGIVTASATGRIGTADREPNGELRIEAPTRLGDLGFAAYRRLVAMNEEDQPFGIGNSLSALALGNDEADYYRALGVELSGAPATWSAGWYSWRLFAQQERSAVKRTDFSVAHLFDEAAVFEDNRLADRADQVGGEIRLRSGTPPRGLWALNGELSLAAAAGTRQYLSPSAFAVTRFPLPGNLAGSFQLASGVTFGEPGLQHLWWLGGSSSVRGYPNGFLFGDAFWRTRAEVGTELPAARIILFGDAGWAGSRDDFEVEPSLLSVGIGAGLLDGLFRLDLARPLKLRSDWRLTAYLNGWF